MYALHLAASAIRNGDCESAIVAACNCILDPGTQLMMAKLGVLSPSSTCHTFDASADGYARGEGFAALYLTKMSTAINKEKPIRALLRGTAVNANGRTGGITHPSKIQQEAMILKAYDNAGLQLHDTTYFECRGTGTPVGDPIEVSAIGNAFRHSITPENPLLVGSIKTNVGHTEATSAIAGIMKVVLALESGLIPPSIGVQQLNSGIDFRAGAIKVLTETTSWPKGRLRRASINSFGYGGANGHCIIDHVHNVLPQYTKPGVLHSENLLRINLAHKQNHSVSVDKVNQISRGTLDTSPEKPHRMTDTVVLRDVNAACRRLVILPFSAHSETSLQRNLNALERVIGEHSLADVSYTLSTNRTRFPHRTFRILDSKNATIHTCLDEKVLVCGAEPLKLAFIFTGQGAQWHGMGSELFQYHTFKRTICLLDNVLESLPDPPAWKIESILSGHCEDGLIDVAEISQTVCTAVGIGLVDLLSAWKVVPSVIVGHSSGEIAATYAAGRITAAEAIVTAYFRGRAVARNITEGTMLAVGLSSIQVETYVSCAGGKVLIAAINSHESVTLSGDAAEIDKISQKMTEENIFNRRLQTGGNAYHSHHMLLLGDHYVDELSKGLQHVTRLGMARPQLRKSTVPWISTVTPNMDTKSVQVDTTYWRTNLESPVLFSEAIGKMMNLDVGGIIEIGPHAALRGPVTQLLLSRNKTVPYMASLKRGMDSQASMLRLAGVLFCLNAQVDIAIVNSQDRIDEGKHSFITGCTAIDLPPYQYSYGPINYHESRISKEFRGRSVIHHDLLGSKVPGNSKFQPSWRNFLRLKNLAWLGDHKLLPYTVFPAAGYMAMAMEAASCLHHESRNSPPINGFSLKNVHVGAALRIPEDDFGIEIITNMELAESANANIPVYAKFSISSVFGDSDIWTEHCSGSIKVETENGKLFNKMSSEMDARTVDKGSWYRKFRDIGLGYGPTFQCLSTIRADPALGLATSNISLKTTMGMANCGDSNYPIHPTSLDAIYQLALIACYGGQTDKASRAFVPVHIGYCYVKNGIGVDRAVGIARGEILGLRGAYADLQMQDQRGDVVLDIRGSRYVSHMDVLPVQEVKGPFAAPFLRLIWKPDIRFLTNDQVRKWFPPPPENVNRAYMFDTLERLVALMVAEIHDQYEIKADLPRASENIQQFLGWIRRRMADTLGPITEAKRLHSTQRLTLISQLIKENNEFSDIRLAQHLFENMGDILFERKTGLDVLVQDGHLAAMYDSGVVMTGSYPQLFRYFDSIGHVDPNLSILEVGAGTGGATRIVLKALSSGSGPKRFKRYTFTDISTGFLAEAKRYLSRYPDVDFSMLNIEENPLDQGYAAVYDVILASECVHATSSISRTLANCQKLLKPGGKLVLIENTKTLMGHGFALGTLPGYWSGIADGRVGSPFLDLEGWNSCLSRSGFSGVDTVLDDYPAPYTCACIMISTALGEKPLAVGFNDINGASQVSLIHGTTKPKLIGHLEEELERQHISYNLHAIDLLDDVALPSGSRAIVFLDENDFLINADEHRLDMVKLIIRNTSSLVWITSSGFVKGKIPDGAVTVGLLRTLGTENPISKLLSIDIDPDEDLQDRCLYKSIIEQENFLRSRGSAGSHDYEYVWQDGCLWTSRLVPDATLQDHSILAEKPPSRAEYLPFGQQGPIRADFVTPGVLTTLYFKPYEDMWKALPDDWIQVKVAAVSLNWKDLGTASGRFDANMLSSEFVGVVDQIGSAVTNVEVGDRVYGIAKGHMGNYVRALSIFAQRLEQGDDFVQMSTMPIVYATAFYAFEHVTQLKEDEKVLIQSATGGLGFAAIRVAQMKGAEIFATTSTPEKARYLTEVLGIKADHIFSSRNLADVPKLMNASGGRGFDVILGTASGDMLYETMGILAPLGRYIDVGRVDVRASKSLGLKLFENSATFSSFDLMNVADRQPNIIGVLMKTIDKHFRTGRIDPIHKIRVFDVSQLHEALLELSKATHIGKFVITFQNPDSLVKLVPSVPTARFSQHAQYVVTGGFGNLGRSIINWMATRGCRYFTILSRTGAETPEAHAHINNLAARGVEVQSINCDISEFNDVSRAITHASAVRPIHGIIHAAVSYQVSTR